MGFNMVIDDSLRSRIDERARQLGLSTAAYIRSTIVKSLEEDERK